jgi:hypothetical protein
VVTPVDPFQRMSDEYLEAWWAEFWAALEVQQEFMRALVSPPKPKPQLKLIQGGKT